VMHGYMHGTAIDEERGSNGFGYDYLFIPEGYSQTLGELSDEIKLAISHRTNALKMAQIVLKSIARYR